MLLGNIFARLLGDKPDDIAKLSAFISANLTTDRFDEILEIITDQQQVLLAGRKMHDLNDNELVDYSELVNMKHELEAAKLKRAMNADFMSWLLYEDGLVTLKRVATILLV